ncbi:MAG: hypothetical protein GF383_08440 [Candidatus Lokiarchaeota archaeon]|nr:hypothetical protein [Candidatus Lokiarchaeota archaeon]MBD3340387.1 hypothetical protein [Candidatus Lokiarchaeota archaeon]
MKLDILLLKNFVPTNPIINANFLNSIEINYFSAAYKNLNTILIIGGIHGDEKPCVDGTFLLKGYLSNPDNQLTKKILRNTSIIIVPILNVAGYLSNARSCPMLNAQIKYKNNNVIIKDDEKGMYKFPPGWQDPNRGWEENQTLARLHLKKLISDYNPTFIIFNHDWSLPQARVKIYGESLISEKLSNVSKILERIYPPHNAFGQPWNFVQLYYEKDKNNMTFKIWEKYKIPNILTETYFVGKQSPKIHLITN